MPSFLPIDGSLVVSVVKRIIPELSTCVLIVLKFCVVFNEMHSESQSPAGILWSDASPHLGNCKQRRLQPPIGSSSAER